jgi:hypothetical protein|uniref:Uncharacterized protein n=1 Tax=Cyanidiaceae sp. MX-AZ01 TaxID=1503164 RepID=A0A060AEK7_9RHOD|nr:hypothetical protein [Cyanidiaceae sp. MX-AZ01]UNJ15426.1 hypothetical protein [Cyanidioschyzonaceae sp. 1]
MFLANLYLIFLCIFLLVVNRWLVLSLLSSNDIVQRLIQQKRYATVIAYLGNDKNDARVSYCYRQMRSG